MLSDRRSTLAALLAGVSSAFATRSSGAAQQRSGEAPPIAVGQSGDAKLPNGKSQRDAILEADSERNLKDVAELVDLAQQLQLEIEKNGAFVFSLAALKKTDDIEKLVKKIRGRMRHN